MRWGKRIVLFLAVNILVMLTLSFVLSFLGVGNYLTNAGIDYSNLMVFCLVWGMGGAFISLGLSRIMAKWMMGVQVIDPSTRDPQLKQLVDTVYRLAQRAGMTTMPQVGVYDSPEINAFATGPTRSRALVAVSSGLLTRMNNREIEGVLGHEVAHIANGDMVTMTLIQGVVNAFVMFLARAIAFAITQGTRSRDEQSSASPVMYHITVFVLEMVFMILGTIVVAWFSRLREYRADQGGADLAGKQNMVAALQALKRAFSPDVVDQEAERPAIASLKISGRPSGFLALFSTHPPLEARIARLEGQMSLK